MKFRTAQPCDLCKRPGCGFEHIRTDLSPEAMYALLHLLPVMADWHLQSDRIGLSIELQNFRNLLISSLQRWELTPAVRSASVPPPSDNSDLL